MTLITSALSYSRSERAFGDLSDEKLMVLFREQGVRAALNELMRRHCGCALSLARSYLHDKGEAEDIVQESFMRVIRACASYDASQPFTAWYYTILRRLCLDLLRKRKVRRLFGFSLQNETDHEPVSESSDLPSLSILDNLRGPEREVLRLRIISELSFLEISQVLGCSEEAAKKRAQRGLKHLREYLSPDS